MGNLYNKVDKLCERKGVTMAQMCKDIGVRRSVMSDLKSGRKSGLSAKTLNKIADYFSVSIDSIVGDKKNAAPKGGGHSHIAEETASFIDTLPPDEQERVRRVVRGMYAELSDKQ